MTQTDLQAIADDLLQFGSPILRAFGAPVVELRITELPGDLAGRYTSNPRGQALIEIDPRCAHIKDTLIHELAHHLVHTLICAGAGHGPLFLSALLLARRAAGLDYLDAEHESQQWPAWSRPGFLRALARAQGDVGEVEHLRPADALRKISSGYWLPWLHCHYTDLRANLEHILSRGAYLIIMATAGLVGAHMLHLF